MTFHDQTTFSDRRAGTFGDCARACVLTLSPIQMVLPHPIKSEAEWNTEFFEAIESYGFALMYQPVRPGKDYSFLPDICAAGGNTARTEDSGASHMVVYDMQAGDVLHDPHPSRTGLISIDGFYWLQDEKSEISACSR